MQYRPSIIGPWDEIPGRMLKTALLLILLPVTLLAQDPPPRAGHAMATAGPDGGVLMLGGHIDNTARTVDTLWRWDESRWSALSTTGPGNRALPAAAFDTRRNVLVVYGGTDVAGNTTFGETWEWDGRSWQNMKVPTPGSRDHHAMVYDEGRGVVVMYSGATTTDSRFRNDTWTYDGKGWTLADTVTGPGGLVHHSMAYDAKRRRTVLYGGIGSNRMPSDETWEWDGARWMRIDVMGSGPGPRARHRMAYDAERGETLLFGGVTGDADPPAGYLNDVWEWDGSNWARASSANMRLMS